MSALDDFTVALAKGGNQPQTVFDAMASLTEALIGVRLFTLMTFDPVNRLAQRIYSNMPDAYPVLGTKEVSDGLWTGRVLDRQETFVANTIEGIAEVFDDHELIQSLGCESVINVPVIVAGRILGTLNCLACRRALHARTRCHVRTTEIAWRRLFPGARGAALRGRKLMAAKSIRVATDVGGTFTDLVCFETDLDNGRATVRTAKSDTTPPDFEQGVLNVLKKGEVDPATVNFLAHGTTVVINALTERKGVRVGLVTTDGFRDTLEIARGNRPDFFNLHYQKPEPFVPRYLRREVPGRMTYRGEERAPLNLSGLPAIVEDFQKEGVEAVAVCFLHSYANPSHEKAAGRRIASALAGRFRRCFAPDHPRMARI